MSGFRFGKFFGIKVHIDWICLDLHTRDVESGVNVQASAPGMDQLRSTGTGWNYSSTQAK